MSKQALSSNDPMPAIHIQPDGTLRSTPDTVLWGYIANLPLAVTIKWGQLVQIFVEDNQDSFQRERNDNEHCAA